MEEENSVGRDINNGSKCVHIFAVSLWNWKSESTSNGHRDSGINLTDKFNAGMISQKK
jgi:hypothetical protein